MIKEIYIPKLMERHEYMEKLDKEFEHSIEIREDSVGFLHTPKRKQVKCFIFVRKKRTQKEYDKINAELVTFKNLFNSEPEIHFVYCCPAPVKKINVQLNMFEND